MDNTPVKWLLDNPSADFQAESKIIASMLGLGSEYYDDVLQILKSGRWKEKRDYLQYIAGEMRNVAVSRKDHGTALDTLEAPLSFRKRHSHRLLGISDAGSFSEALRQPADSTGTADRDPSEYFSKQSADSDDYQSDEDTITYPIDDFLVFKCESIPYIDLRELVNWAGLDDVELEVLQLRWKGVSDEEILNRPNLATTRRRSRNNACWRLAQKSDDICRAFADLIDIKQKPELAHASLPLPPGMSNAERQATKQAQERTKQRLEAERKALNDRMAAVLELGGARENLPERIHNAEEKRWQKQQKAAWERLFTSERPAKSGQSARPRNGSIIEQIAKAREDFYISLPKLAEHAGLDPGELEILELRCAGLSRAAVLDAPGLTDDQRRRLQAAWKRLDRHQVALSTAFQELFFL